jgi:hypothetical protein
VNTRRDLTITTFLVARHSFPGCPRLSRYWSDQAGNRLGEIDTLGVPQAQ